MPLLRLTVWSAVVAFSGLAWAGLWRLLWLFVDQLDPLAVATYGAPAGAALALTGMLMATRALVVGQRPAAEARPSRLSRR